MAPSAGGSRDESRGPALLHELDDLLEGVCAWATRRDDVTGVATYGSLARGDADPYSDIDLLVVTGQESGPEGIAREFASRHDSMLAFQRDGKYVLFLRKPAVRVELLVVPEKRLQEVHRLFVESRIPDASRAVLLDKTGALTRAVTSWTGNRAEVDEGKAFEREANSFLYYYESFHAPFSRGDVYRAFFEYSLAFFKLATLAYIAAGGSDHLYAPKSLLHSVPTADARKLHQMAPAMEPLEMRRRKEMTFDFFLELVRRTGREEAFPPRVLETLRASILKRYPRFWQLRDLGTVPRVRRGLAYRSARLDRYDTEAFRGELVEWLRSSGVRTLVDFRTDEELEGRGYGLEILRAVDYIRLPITTNPEELSSAGEEVPASPVRRFYAGLPFHESFRAALRGVFGILADARRCPVVIHCRGGTDRTGMLMAVLLSAVGVDRDAVSRDYLLSYGHTKPEYLEETFRAIESAGGLSAYLEAAGVLPKDLARVHQALVAGAVDSRSNETQHNPLNGAPRS